MTELKEKENKQKQFQVGSGNVISQIFFIWVFRFIFVLRKSSNLKDLILVLRETETSDYNDKILEAKWADEKQRAKLRGKQPSIKSAIFRAFGLTFALNGLFKILWGISLWLGAYWLLKQTVALVRDITGKVLCSNMYFFAQIYNFLINIKRKLILYQLYCDISATILLPSLN
jgi:hypothetical protein